MLLARMPEKSHRLWRVCICAIAAPLQFNHTGTFGSLPRRFIFCAHNSHHRDLVPPVLSLSTVVVLAEPSELSTREMQHSGYSLAVNWSISESVQIILE